MAIKIYEMIDMNRGGIFHDFTDGFETRHAYWAQQPYSVSDGPVEMDEEFMRFVENRNEYIIDRPIFHIKSLGERFERAVGSMPIYTDVDDDRMYTLLENMMKLQEYLAKHGAAPGDQLLQEENEPEVKPYSLSREEADKLAGKLAQVKKLQTPKYKGEGGYGFAYDIGNLVLKITSDRAEADSGIKIKNYKPNNVVNIYNVLKLIDTETGKAFYALIMDNVENKPEKVFFHYMEIFEDIAEDISIKKGKEKTAMGSEFLRHMKSRDFDYNKYIKFIESILLGDVDGGYSDEDRKRAFNFYKELGDIKENLKNVGVIKGDDQLSPSNLGYVDGVLTFFDVGGYFFRRGRKCTKVYRYFNRAIRFPNIQ